MKNQQHTFEDKLLTMRVKPAPLFIRLGLFFFAFLFLVGPTVGMIVAMSSGTEPRLMFFLGILFNGAIGIFVLRYALWNSYGTEEIQIFEDKLLYTSNYSWFRDGKKEIEINANLVFSSDQIGYLENKQGVLTIRNDTDFLACVCKVKQHELEEIQAKLYHSIKPVSRG